MNGSQCCPGIITYVQRKDGALPSACPHSITSGERTWNRSLPLPDRLISNIVGTVLFDSWIHSVRCFIVLNSSEI